MDGDRGLGPVDGRIEVGDAKCIDGLSPGALFPAWAFGSLSICPVSTGALFLRGGGEARNVVKNLIGEVLRDAVRNSSS